MFKVGDYVKGNSPNSYSITNDLMTLGVIIGTYPNDEINVRILCHIDDDSIGIPFRVESQYFDKVDYTGGCPKSC